jgi:hypothetical protein
VPRDRLARALTVCSHAGNMPLRHDAPDPRVVTAEMSGPVDCACGTAAAPTTAKTRRTRPVTVSLDEADRPIVAAPPEARE